MLCGFRFYFSTSFYLFFRLLLFIFNVFLSLFFFTLFIFLSACFPFFGDISKKHFCGVVAEAFESKSNRLHVRFFATRAGLPSKFILLYTAFTKKKPVDGRNTTLACAEDEFDCDDDTCIDLTLKCNQQPNCKFKKDEAACEVTILIQ